jgi:peroxiredoxin Q/BCP
MALFRPLMQGGSGAEREFGLKVLANPDHKVIDAYGVPVHSFGTMHYVERMTFLLSPHGGIVKEWDVKDIPSHSAEILAAIESLSK